MCQVKYHAHWQVSVRLIGAYLRIAETDVVLTKTISAKRQKRCIPTIRNRC